MLTFSLDGAWEVLSQPLTCRDTAGYAVVAASADGWLPAQVPGEVHLDLIRAGRMPEPSVGVPAPECRWPETQSWWFRSRFDASDALLGHERVELVCDGLDLFAQVFVNGILAGEAANALVPAVFDLKALLHAGENELVVRLTAGSELARDETPPGQGQAPMPSRAAEGAIPNPAGEEDLYGHRIWPGKKWLRKAQFSYGWDWVDALPNIGIWRGVHIEGRSHAVLADIRLDTRLHDGQVTLALDAVVDNLHPWAERRCTLHVAISPPDGGPALTRRYPLDAMPGHTAVRDGIVVPDAQLWWPNGMGAQPLYRVVAEVYAADGTVCDARAFHIGLRTVEIDRAPLAEGSRFCIRVNGEDVFCRGGNIGPHDMIPARISDAKQEALVAEAAHAQMNMLRINGCSIYEAPAFYDACDRHGILVWHDFMLTCTTYPDAITAAVEAEVRAIVPALRHHPSIALWCGNNECTWGFRDWWNPDKTQPLDLGGQHLYNRVIPDLCRVLDPHRPYWVSSPSGGEEPNSELAGDCHWWHPFFMSTEMNRRIRHETFDECRARFVSEYGVIGPCHLDSLREYLAPEELQPESRAWRIHTNTFEQETVPAAIRRHYADPENLSVPDYLRYGQAFQALIHGNAMEALRFRKGDAADDCQGALIWSYSDCWGETGWSILDYYLRRKASYYAFRRACRPVKIIVRQRGEMLVTRVVNDTREAISTTAEVGWWRMDGTAREVRTLPVAVAANGAYTLDTAPLAPARDPREWLFAAVLREDGAPVDQSLLTFAPYRELAGVNAPLVVTAQADGLRVACAAYRHAVHVDDHGRALLSDNWFDLLPGVPVCLRPAEGAAVGAVDFADIGGYLRCGAL